MSRITGEEAAREAAAAGVERKTGGRPRGVKYGEETHLRLTAEEKRLAGELAVRYGCSEAEAIRRCIRLIAAAAGIREAEG